MLRASIVGKEEIDWLIELVREGVCLYDRSKQEYKDTELHNNTWEISPK